jgi:putative MATE family efflux protein
MQAFVKDRGFYKKLYAIALPITLQGLVNFGVNMVDTVVMGSLGETALSAVSLANQFCFLFMILNFGLAGGAGVLTGQFWGKGDRESIVKTLSIVYRITAGLAALFFIAAYFFPHKVMSLYTADAGVIEQGAAFLRVISWSFLLQGLSTITAFVLRTVGVVRLPLVTSCVTLANNILMNWIFVFGNLGAPSLGTAGSALATSVSRLLEFVIIAVFMLRIDKRIRLRLKTLLKTDKAILSDYARNGLPVLVSDFILALGMNVMAAIMGRIGEDFVAAYAIAGVVWQLTTVLLMGTAGASSVIVGNTVGEKRYADAQSYGVTFLAFSVIVGLLASAVIIAVKDLAVGIYNVEDATKDIARSLMDAIALLSAFSSVQMMLTKGVLRAGGDTRFLMVADVLFMWAASVPLGFVAALVLGWPPLAVMLCLKVDEAIKAVWCTKRLFGKKWIRNVTLE